MYIRVETRTVIVSCKEIFHIQKSTPQPKYAHFFKNDNVL